jgi:hypothetical protein
VGNLPNGGSENLKVQGSGTPSPSPLLELFHLDMSSKKSRHHSQALWTPFRSSSCRNTGGKASEIIQATRKRLGMHVLLNDVEERNPFRVHAGKIELKTTISFRKSEGVIIEENRGE